MSSIKCENIYDTVINSINGLKLETVIYSI